MTTPSPSAGVCSDVTPLHRQSFRQLVQRAQRLRDDRAGAWLGRTPVRRRVAVLGGFTTSFVTRILDVFLSDYGIDADLYESPYGSLTEQVLNPRSQLYAFAPEITLLLVHRGNLDGLPEPLSSAAAVGELARCEAERWYAYAQTIRSRVDSRIIQSNFELPELRALGNFDGPSGYGAAGYVREVNAQLTRTRPSAVTLFDLEYLSAHFGLQRALDTKSYCLTKQPFSFEFLVPYCHALARAIAQAAGLSKKCLVLDLDGTLWGGTLAEDGVEGLVLGPDSAEGEAFSAFQRYVKALKRRGVLLAVCSKNDEAAAQKAFAAHPHMQLGPADIACFVANWHDKATNLTHIAQTLGIGLDALVFADNSPEERHLVRLQLPEVSVIELPDDPAGYAQAIDEGAYFEVAEVTQESLSRSDSLVQNQVRARNAERFLDYDAYLRSLELQATIAPITGRAFERCAELITRSNQFNLRSVRHSQAALQDFLAAPGNLGFCVALRDRFGHYGIISVVLLQAHGQAQQQALFIDTWLMSCRVLNKGVEALVYNEIVRLAEQRALPRLLAEYRPTAKNQLVAKLLPDLGFQATATSAQGYQQYRLELPRPEPPAQHFIHIDRDLAP